MKKITSVIIVGGGTAGLISALALRIKLPELSVKVVRSTAIGVIGVGEGTIGNFNNFFFDYLNLDRSEFHTQANPTWKLGIKFNWGRRDYFNYSFTSNSAWKWDDQRFANGFYCSEEFKHATQDSSLMDVDKCFLKKECGEPLIGEYAVYHLENERFVAYLEQQAEKYGIELIDAKIDHVGCTDQGVDHLILSNQLKLHADFFVDASGFNSLLLNKTLKEPFESFNSSLFCDRALIGSWKRTSEEIRSYTTSDTMNAGWSWRIDHEHHINRGYVYSSSFISTEEAEAEFREKNPLLGELNQISFQPGKYQNSWVKNVVAIGNSSGFVEPLEATSIGVICIHSMKLIDSFKSSHCQPNDIVREIYNTYIDDLWESTRRFLALHYKLNTQFDTPFWKTCREKTYLGKALEKVVEFYQIYGPDNKLLHDLIPTPDLFGVDGYLTIMVGMQLGYDCSKFTISEDEWVKWKAHQQLTKQQSELNSFSVREALGITRSPDWEW